MPNATQPSTPGPAEAVRDTEQTACCVVGGGPAGVMLALLLARKGVPVTLLEAHKDFDRDFRGDTIHPSTLDVLDQLGLADRLLEIPHGKVDRLRVRTPQAEFTMIDFQGLKTRFPYIAMLPQARMLDFLAESASGYPAFRRVMGANVQRLVEEEGVVRGVRYRGADGDWHEVRAALTVAADGRFSKVRSLAGLEPIKTAPPMDIVWLRLPRRPDDPHDSGTFYIDGGRFAVVLDRGDEWQVAYVILKGSFAQLREAGAGALRQALAALIPWLADRVDQFHDWKQASVLSVESSRLSTWHKPGLLLIGDAAHVMSPVGGVGINYAIQDAVEAANLLGATLKQGAVPERDLAAFQRRREGPTRAIQTFQRFLQQRIGVSALQKDRPFRVPLILRIVRGLPILRRLPGRMIAFGLHRVRVDD